MQRLAGRVRGRIARIVYGRPLLGPEQWFIYSDIASLVYCPIPKNACTSLKSWILAVHGVRLDAAAIQSGEIHRLCQERMSLGVLPRRRAWTVLRDCPKIVVVRNPLDRLVSAYLDKFVLGYALEEAAPAVLDSVAKVQNGSGLGQASLEKGISFQDFCSLVCSQTREDDVDPHWRSQFTFMGGAAFDHVLRMETLAQGMASLRARLGITVPVPALHQTPVASAPRGVGPESYSRMLPAELMGLGALPPYQDFYTESMRDAVRQRYQEDFARFGYAV